MATSIQEYQAQYDAMPQMQENQQLSLLIPLELPEGRSIKQAYLNTVVLHSPAVNYSTPTLPGQLPMTLTEQGLELVMVHNDYAIKGIVRGNMRLELDDKSIFEQSQIPLVWLR
mgnify:CR=1 FL=1